MLDPRFVDTKEQSRVFPLQIAGFVPKHLDSGDVYFTVFGGKTGGIENKRVYQLLEDMKTGQLIKQMRRLVEYYDYPILGVEGSWMHNGTPDYILSAYPYSWSQAWNELQTIQDMGVRLQITTGEKHTITRIIEVCEYYSKPEHPSALREVAGDKRVMVLDLIDGVGSKMALKLLLYFGSLSAIARAPTASLQDVADVGPKLARRIYEFFHEEYKPPALNGNTAHLILPQNEIAKENIAQ